MTKTEAKKLRLELKRAKRRATVAENKLKALERKHFNITLELQECKKNSAIMKMDLNQLKDNLQSEIRSRGR